MMTEHVDKFEFEEMGSDEISTDMLELMDYFGTHHAEDEKKTGFHMLLAEEKLWMFPFWKRAGGYMNVR